MVVLLTEEVHITHYCGKMLKLRIIKSMNETRTLSLYKKNSSLFGKKTIYNLFLSCIRNIE